MHTTLFLVVSICICFCLFSTATANDEIENILERSSLRNVDKALGLDYKVFRPAEAGKNNRQLTASFVQKTMSGLKVVGKGLLKVIVFILEVLIGAATYINSFFSRLF